jgi:hypothetical protein
MRTAAHRASRSHVPRDRSNRSGLRGSDARDGYNTYLTKRTHPWRIRTHARCYSRLLREANRVVWDPARCRKSGVGYTPRAVHGLKPAFEPAVPRTGRGPQGAFFRPPAAPGRRIRRAPSHKSASAPDFPQWSCGHRGSPAHSRATRPAATRPRHIPCIPGLCWPYRL